MSTSKNINRWLLSLACASLLACGTLTSCSNQQDASSPTATQLGFNPHAMNGVDLSSTIAVQNRHTDELMSIDGVIGTGTGLFTDGTPAIYIFTSRDGVLGLPASIEGTHTLIKNVGVIESGIPSVNGGLGTRNLDPKIQAAGYTGTYRTPMYSGVSIGNDNECAAGTISCVVTDNATQTHRYLLSNNHVFARVNAAKLGERIDQQGRYDAVPQCAQTGQVASLSRFVQIAFGRKTSNVVDCAISEISNGITATSESATTNYTPSATPVAAAVGMNVMKTGRTTGFTTGSIAAINVTVSVSYGNNQTAKFVGQIYIASATFSAAGDSGSLIVEQVNGAPSPVGLLFAGSSNSTIANPIGNVLTALAVSIVPN